MECGYCKRTFANASSLGKHQHTTKACLLLQQQLGITTTYKLHECVFCKKKLTSKENLEKHNVTCKIKKIKQHDQHKEELKDKVEQLSFELQNHKEEMEYEIKLKEERIQIELQLKDAKIKALEEQINKVKTPQKITNQTTIETNIENQTNHITIYQIMSPEHVEDFFNKHYHLDTLLGGQKALARFVNDGFLKEAPVYMCGDRSRQKFYIINDGTKTEDTNCEKILELTSPGLPRVQEVYETALFNELPERVTEDDIQDNYQQLMSMDDNRTDFKSELSRIVSSEITGDTKPLSFKQMLHKMKERSDRLGLTTRENKEVKEEIVKRDDVLGYSRGKLMVYRDRYRKDGTVKGPPSIMEQIQSDEEAKLEYMSYLQE